MIKDLCVRESYTKDGEEKVSWNKVGIMIENENGKAFIKLFHMPGAYIGVFDQKKKEEQAEKEGF